MFEELKVKIVSLPDLDLKTLFMVLDILGKSLSKTEYEKYFIMLKDLYEFKHIQKSIDTTMFNVRINDLENRLNLLKKAIN